MFLICAAGLQGGTEACSCQECCITCHAKQASEGGTQARILLPSDGSAD